MRPVAQQPFELSETGWGEFDIGVVVSNQKQAQALAAVDAARFGYMIWSNMELQGSIFIIPTDLALLQKLLQKPQKSIDSEACEILSHSTFTDASAVNHL